MAILNDTRCKLTLLPNVVNIKPLATKDSNNVVRWMTSSYILQHSFVVNSPKIIPHDFATTGYAKRYFEVLLNDPHRKTFIIHYKTLPIGTIGLKDINLTQLHAECFIEIGEPPFRGCGLGKMAMKQLLDVAFLQLFLQQVDLDVLEFNAPAIKTYHRLGFKPRASATWHYDEFGQYWHVIRMSLTQDDYQKQPRNL